MSEYTELEVHAISDLVGGYFCVQRELRIWKQVLHAFIRGRHRLRKGTLDEVPDQHRRWILDFPDAQAQDQRLRAVSSLTLAELWAKANARPEDLTGTEADFLIDRYWSNLEAEERAKNTKGMFDLKTGRSSNASGSATWNFTPEQAKSLILDLVELREALSSEVEMQALRKAEQVWGERRREDRARIACIGCTRPWMCRWYAEYAEDHRKCAMGYIVYCDRAAQRLLPGYDLDVGSRNFAFRGRFRVANMATLRSLEAYVMETRLTFDWEAPQDAPEVVDADTIDSGQDMEFHAFKREWPRYNASIKESAIAHFRDVFQIKKISGQLRNGFLENTFLIADPTCVNSLLTEGTHIQDGRKTEWVSRRLGYPGRRVLAVDAEYPVPGKAYAEGYRGYVWVRMRQLCDEFYEQRWQHPEVGMDMIWEAAKDRKYHAFDGMDSGDEPSTNASDQSSLAFRPPLRA